MVDTSRWPANVKSIDIAQVDYIGVDEKKRLYWDGVPIVTSPLASLSTREKLVAATVAIAAVLGGVGSFAQGWAAYNDWACKMHWHACICPT